jgi:hypothetical protein
VVPDYRQRLAHGTDQGQWLMQQVGQSASAESRPRRAAKPPPRMYHELPTMPEWPAANGGAAAAPAAPSPAASAPAAPRPAAPPAAAAIFGGAEEPSGVSEEGVETVRVSIHRGGAPLGMFVSELNIVTEVHSMAWHSMA